MAAREEKGAGLFWVCVRGGGGGCRKRREIVKLHLAYLSGSQTRTDLIIPFKGLTRARSLAHCRPAGELRDPVPIERWGRRVGVGSGEWGWEDRKGLPPNTEPFPRRWEGVKEKHMQIDGR